jgi:hypothetical protein
MKAKITPTVMDGIVVRWQVDPDNHHLGEISASRNGVAIGGYFPLLTTPTCSRDFLSALANAWEMYRRLAKAAERFFERVTTEQAEQWLAEIEAAPAADLLFQEGA